jgi:hypothetical protein
MGRRVSATARAAHRNRRRLAALYATLGTAGAAAALHALPGGEACALALGAAPAAVGGVRRVRAVRAARREQAAAPSLTRSQRAGWAARGAVAAWLPLATQVGFTTPVRDALAGGALLGLTGWGLHLRGDRAPEEVQDAEAEQAGPIERAWTEFIGCPGGALPGSVLTNVVEHEMGWSAILVLVKGRQTVAQARMCADRIAGAYDTATTAVSFKELPGTPQNRIQITLFLANPLQQVQAFVRPSLDPKTGWLTAGLTAHGEPARWRLWEPDSGPCGGMIFGAQGTGKSSLLNTLFIEITHSGVAVLWLGDGQNGLSAPDWTDAGSDWFADGETEVERMLAAALRVMRGRQRRRRGRKHTDRKGRVRRGMGSFTPTPEEPALFIVVDEWPLVAKSDVGEKCVETAAKLEQGGRKVGIACILVGQIPSVDEFGGKSPKGSVVRNLAATTNVAMFRTSPADKASQHMGGMGIAGIDPALIPIAFPDGSATQGLGYLRSYDGSVATMRALFPDDPYEWALTAPEVRLEPEAIKDAGEDYATWRERREALLDAGLLEEDLEANEDEDLEDEDAGDARASAPAGMVLLMPGQGSGALRSLAVTILNTTARPLSGNQLVDQIKALTGDSKVALNAVTNALKRAERDSQVVSLPASGADKSARWIAAAFAAAADREPAHV